MMFLRADLRQELLAMRADDSQTYEELERSGRLGTGYHPTLRRVQDRNAERLRMIVEEIGWPGRSAVGDDGAEAAWLIVQHAVAKPALMRTSVRLLEKAVEDGEIPAWQWAYLTDRIAFLEGRPQRYGTQLEVDDPGVAVAARRSGAGERVSASGRAGSHS